MSPPLWGLPFLIGNDICRVARIRQILSAGKGPRFIRRVLSPTELVNPATTRILECVSEESLRSDSEPTASDAIKDRADSSLQKSVGFKRAAEFMAGRFAAKEAVIKAHPYRRLTFRQIDIVRADLNPSTVGFDKVFAPLSHVQFWWPPEKSVSEQTKQQPENSEASASSGGPLVACFRSTEGAGDDGNKTYASVSISHEGDYATAVCLGWNRNWKGQIGFTNLA
ncbi:hypothetical protein F5Y18DRAFT_430925 [Xylariaceae sp. FL1019]|nr:hypothetical protein F5Y18DRAFT_430925 [Xylariaceae sp. FL1019]